MQQLEAREVPLNKVFCGDYDFHIPEYQRPYAWQVEQAGQLLEDLVEAMDRGGDEPYFLGSIVLVKSPNSARAEVIDGQQRLTTLTILLAVLRDSTTNPELAKQIDAMLQEQGSLMLDRESKPRLALRARDREFFAEHVQSPGGIKLLEYVKPGNLRTDAQRAIHGNGRALFGTISEWVEDRRLQLTKMLAARTFLVVVTTPDLASAHRIFSVMNSRGLDLSAADIFKARVVGDVAESRRDEYADRWDDAEEALGTDDFADLFLHIRTIVVKERPKKELLKEFEESVLSSYIPGKGAEFVDSVVVPYAEAYGTLRDQNYTSSSGAEEVNRWLKRLDQLDNSDWRAPALWALRNKSDDPEFLNSFFRSLERLAASMLVRRVYATPRASRYIQLLKDLTAGHGLDSPAFELSGDEVKETGDRLRGEIYKVAPVRKYVLLRLDELLSDASGVSYDHPRISVEHVLPQNPKVGSDWMKWFTPAQREFWTHRLGNLVLLNRTKNASAGNYDFDRKKTQYFTAKYGVASFAITTQVLQQKKWTADILEERQKELVGLLTKEWRLEGGLW
ncbi:MULTISPECIES: DUF262 domain-containing protein [Rhodococcus]|uniref:DUF262 domain-containing protein n=1 Tax=Rhodococcus TaxID=1827 RepID=UPI0011A853CD|nr:MULTISPECIES: DUF262 domain-containing protein [Rhodococcus]MDC3728841.1 DUF262 domain-containing protein [Rhodococcus sp. Rp3]